GLGEPDFAVAGGLGETEGGELRDQRARGGRSHAHPPGEHARGDPLALTLELVALAQVVLSGVADALVPSPRAPQPPSSPVAYMTPIPVRKPPTTCPERSPPGARRAT